MKRIYARGDFERPATRSDDPLHPVLTADLAESRGGPNYLRFGLGLSSDLLATVFSAGSQLSRT